MHFLGMLGMPRRIPDYPDQFYFWNKIASFGSLFTFFGIFLFLIMIFDVLKTRKVKKYI